MVDNGVETYGYGAGNRRLWKKSTVSGSWAEVYLYGLGGEVLEAFRGMMGSPLERQSYTPTQRAWFGGRLIEKLGTAMNADRLGSYQGTYPYGELQGAVGTPGEKFGTYWRDATGLDYAVNRYYSSQMGRFSTADPYVAGGGAADSGSWNRYAYVEGDPVNLTDRNGLQADPCYGEDHSENSVCGQRMRQNANTALIFSSAFDPTIGMPTAMQTALQAFDQSVQATLNALIPTTVAQAPPIEVVTSYVLDENGVPTPDQGPGLDENGAGAQYLQTTLTFGVPLLPISAGISVTVTAADSLSVGGVASAGFPPALPTFSSVLGYAYAHLNDFINGWGGGRDARIRLNYWRSVESV